LLSLVCQLRTKFDDDIPSAVEHSRRHSQPLALVIYFYAWLNGFDFCLPMRDTVAELFAIAYHSSCLMFFLRAADEETWSF